MRWLPLLALLNILAGAGYFAVAVPTFSETVDEHETGILIFGVLNVIAGIFACVRVVVAWPR